MTAVQLASGSRKAPRWHGGGPRCRVHARPRLRVAWLPLKSGVRARHRLQLDVAAQPVPAQFGPDRPELPKLKSLFIVINRKKMRAWLEFSTRCDI